MRPVSARPIFLRRALAVAAVLVASAAAAQSGGSQAARDEVEKQLREMVGKPPTRVKVTFSGLDEPGYKIVEAQLTLDGAPLSTPPVATLTQEGEHLVFQGDYLPGDHRLDARVVISDSSGVMFSNENGFKWKVSVSRSFNLQPGLEVHVVLKPARNSETRDPKQKFKLTSTATPRMLAVLDDGSMPDPMAKKVAAAEVDAGRGPTEAEKAAEAKRLAAEEKKRLAGEAKAARLAAAEEKSRLAGEAKAARLAAAEEKKRLAAPGASPSPVGAGPAGAAAAPAVDAREVGAGAEVAEVLDAGTPTVAIALPPPPPAPEGPEAGMPWLLIAGVGALVLAGLVFFVVRRRSNPRDPEL